MTESKSDPRTQAFMMVRREVLKHQGEIEKAVPRGIAAGRIVRVFLSAVSNSDKLIEISRTGPGRKSLIVALMESAALGLEADGLLGQGWIIPYGGVAKFQVGAQGVLHVARRDGTVLKTQCRTIFANDHWEVRYGSSDDLIHVPGDMENRGKPLAYYAMAWLKAGLTQFHVMTHIEVVAHRDQFSKGYRSAMLRLKKKQLSKSEIPWHEDSGNFEQMAHKTVAIKLTKWLPKTTELQWAVQAATRDELTEKEAREEKPFIDVEGTDVEPKFQEPQPAKKNGAKEPEVLGPDDKGPEKKGFF